MPTSEAIKPPNKAIKPSKEATKPPNDTSSSGNVIQVRMRTPKVHVMKPDASVTSWKPSKDFFLEKN